jgi:hypothetical protein
VIGTPGIFRCIDCAWKTMSAATLGSRSGYSTAVAVSDKTICASSRFHELTIGPNVINTQTSVEYLQRNFPRQLTGP